MKDVNSSSLAHLCIITAALKNNEAPRTYERVLNKLLRANSLPSFSMGRISPPKLNFPLPSSSPVSENYGNYKQTGSDNYGNYKQTGSDNYENYKQTGSPITDLTSSPVTDLCEESSVMTESPSSDMVKSYDITVLDGVKSYDMEVIDVGIKYGEVIDVGIKCDTLDVGRKCYDVVFDVAPECLEHTSVYEQNRKAILATLKFWKHEQVRM